MAESTLDKVERLVDRLSPQEQARLLAFLAQRMAEEVQRRAQPSLPGEGEDAWAELFRVGDSLAAQDRAELETLTAAVTAMRR